MATTMAGGGGGNGFNLRSAVHALYHNPDEGIRREADKWLLDFQTSVAAWETAASALEENGVAEAGTSGRSDGTMEEVQFIAAQTLATKVRRDFDELPSAASIESLREAVVKNLVHFMSKQRLSPVCPQLCIAVAAMAGHMDSASWGGNVVTWIRQRLEQEQPTVAVPCMMHLLSVLPEEAETRRHLRPERRKQFIAELTLCVPIALQLLCSCLETERNNVENQSLALGAYAAWLRLGGTASGDGQVSSNAGVVDCLTLAQHPLTASALRALQSEENFDAAVDVAIELIRRTAPHDVLGEPSADQTPLVQLIVPHVMGMRQFFSQKPNVEAEIDDSIVKGMARLFAEIGEAYVGLLSTGASNVVEPVEVLLEVGAHEDFEIAEMAFRFWERLSKILVLGASERGGKRLVGMSDEERERRRQIFVPVFERLVNSVMRRIKYPEDFDEMHREDKSEFFFMRGCISDCLRDCAAVLGGEGILKIISIPFQEVANAVANGMPFDWSAVEAAMFCIYAVSRFTKSENSPILQQIFASLANIPKQPKLVLMVSNTVGAYSEWFAKILNNGDSSSSGLLPPLLTILGEALAFEDTARPASFALKMICHTCASHLVNQFLEPLLQISQQAVCIGLTYPVNSAVSGLDEASVILVIEGVASVLARIPPERLEPALSAISEQLLHSMKDIASRIPNLIENDWRKACLVADRLAALLKGIMNADASAASFKLFWPYVNALLAVPHINYESAERLCRLCNIVLISSGHHAAEILQHMVPVVKQRFIEQRYCCYIYSTSQMVSLYVSCDLH